MLSLSSHTLFPLLSLFNALRVPAAESNCLIWYIEREDVTHHPALVCALPIWQWQKPSRGHVRAARRTWPCWERSSITLGSFHAFCVNRGQCCTKCHGIKQWFYTGTSKWDGLRSPTPRCKQCVVLSGQVGRASHGWLNEWEWLWSKAITGLILENPLTCCLCDTSLVFY